MAQERSQHVVLLLARIKSLFQGCLGHSEDGLESLLLRGGVYRVTHPISFPTPFLSLLVGAQIVLAQSWFRKRETEGIELMTEIIGACSANVAW